MILVYDPLTANEKHSDSEIEAGSLDDLEESSKVLQRYERGIEEPSQIRARRRVFTPSGGRGGRRRRWWGK